VNVSENRTGEEPNGRKGQLALADNRVVRLEPDRIASDDQPLGRLIAEAVKALTGERSPVGPDDHVNLRGRGGGHDGLRRLTGSEVPLSRGQCQGRRVRWRHECDSCRDGHRAHPG
jgi:hypothetical protein